MPNGEQVPFADGRIAFGWGDVYIGDLLHQFVPDFESDAGMFLYRVHQGQVILRNNGNIKNINKIIGTDVISLFNKPTGITKSGNIMRQDEISAKTIYDLQGRMLQHEPQKGVYIQNGKKVAVK